MHFQNHIKTISAALMFQALSQQTQASDRHDQLQHAIPALSAEQTELYAEALKLRDHKIDGLRKEESRTQAAAKFLDLATFGYPNAMHNYAMIQHQMGNNKLAGSWFLKAANLGFTPSKNNYNRMIQDGLIKKDLFLVVGADRGTYKRAMFFADMIWQDQLGDFSHLKTYDGHATTMDFFPSGLKDTDHIVGDASTYNFKGYTIKAAYLERLDTTDDYVRSLKKTQSANLNKLDNAPTNNIGNCAKNIVEAMEDGAEIQIELDPFTTLICNADNVTLENYIKGNPFNGFFDLNVALFSLFYAAGGQHNGEFSSDFDQRTDKIKKMITELLAFYQQSGFDVPTLSVLHKHILKETKILQRTIINNEAVFLSVNSRDSFKDFDTAKVQFIQNGFHLAGKYIDIDGITGLVHNAASFLQNAFINFILSNVAVQINTPFIIDYMNSIGFEDVSVERATGLNGRKNVWIVKGTKSRL